jgi:type I restriction enzyme, S subunit
MKLDFDITTAEYAVIRGILERLLPPEAKVWVFGSRAKGTARFNSDLDLAVESKAPLAQSQIFALKEAFDDAPLSFRVDVVDLAQVDAGFQKIIKEHRVSFSMPNARQKHLRFPGFEGKWEAKHLGEIVLSIDAGWSPLCLERPANKEEWGVLKTTAVTWDGYDDSQNKALPRKQEPRTNLTVAKGDILITRAGPISRVAVVAYVNDTRSKLMISDKLMRARTSKQVDGDFVARLLGTTHIQNYYSARKSGLAEAQANISQQILSRTPINLPTLPEQRKIAAFLGVVDAKIAGLRAKVEGLETYKRGLMQSLFSQTLRFTKPDGTAFPDWEEKKLGEVFSERSERGNEAAELLSVTLSRGVVRATDIDREDGASSDRSNYKTVHIGDIAYNSMRMWQGANGVSKYFGIVSPAYTVITPKSDQIPLFWGFYFKLSTTIHKFERNSQGLTSDTWNLKFPALSSIRMMVPHSHEQQKIIDALSAMDTKIQAVASQVSHMETFKKGLLQQMFV